MLINKKLARPKAGEVATFRVTTGEEVIGKVVDIDGEDMLVSRPLTLTSTSQGVSFMPVTMLGDPDGEVIYHLTHVVAFMTTRETAQKSYEQAVSGIEIAPASAILTK